MNSARLKLLLVSTFGLVIVLLGLTAYLSWRSNQQQQELNEQVRHTYEIISLVEQVAALSRDIQTDARNYELSGKREFAVAYWQARQQLPERLRLLDQALSNERSEQDRFHRLSRFIDQRRQVSQRLFEKRSQPQVGPTSEDLLAQGRELLSQLRPLVGQLTQHQRALANWRRKQAERAYQVTQQWIILSSGAAIIVIAFVFWLLFVQLLRRIRNEAQLAQYEVELQNQLQQQQAQNQALDQLNQQLTRSNENLQQFAYIASHDLQEPLRKIQQFGDLLKTRYTTSSGEEVMYLNRMQVAASRMSLLIKDLLTFSRISTRPVPAVSVSTKQVVSDVLDTLSVAISETKAQIRVGDLPTLPGDPSQLGQLFQNLLANAIKFSRKDQSGTLMTPEVSIQAIRIPVGELPDAVKPTRLAETFYCIEVTDNGIGFDEKYTDRIFQVFQRLHGKDEFAGTGVGLAICQKVVTNHGGVITATSQPGKGATFSVYLPA
ncbi:sensor histidine kinase [Spirosoma litoris]